MARALTKSAISVRRAIARFKRTFFLAALLLLTIGFAAVGLYLHPVDNGPPAPGGAASELAAVEFDVHFDSLPPANFETDETVTACIGWICGQSLTITFWPPGKKFPGLTLTFIDAYQDNFCPLPFRMQGSDCKFREPAITNGLFEEFTMNFPPGFFFKQDGAYGAGAFPSLQPINFSAPNGFPVDQVEDELSLNGVVTPLQISMLNGPPPSPDDPFSNDYMWNTTSNEGVQELSFITTNPFQLAIDSRNEFLSGIMFGVAGAALIALVVEVMRPKESGSEAGKENAKRAAHERAGFRERQYSTITTPSISAQNLGMQRSTKRDKPILATAFSWSALILIVISVIRSMLRKHSSRAHNSTSIGQ